MVSKKGFLNLNAADRDWRQKSCAVSQDQHFYLAFFQVVEGIVHCHQKPFFVHNCVQVECPGLPKNSHKYLISYWYG